MSTVRRPSSDPELRIPSPPASRPAEVSPRAAAAARRLLRPIERFLHVQAASGGVLLAAAAAALVLANSRYAAAYHHALEAPLGLTFGGATVAVPLHFVVNDVLMTIFFFVVGLEIRREMHGGELSTPRRAALPVAAALGGMLAPALLYAALNRTSSGAPQGWGVPMATDIAFAVGVLTLLGRRVPPALRVLLLALAVIDDVGSIVVIALFYSSGFRAGGLLLAGAGVALTLALQRSGVRRAVVYVVPGVVVWAGVLRSGIHPTLAGVAMGMLTPANTWYGPRRLVDAIRHAAARVSRGLSEGDPATLTVVDLAHERARIDLGLREALSPAERLQGTLHPWVAFGIMPLFAFANAGVTLGERGARDALAVTGITAGIALGLTLGKPVGILVATFVALRLRVAILPRGVRWRELLVLGAVAGVGFTMAIFIASLAFTDPSDLDRAKLAILAASAFAGVAGLVLGWALLPPSFVPAAASSAHDAECSDER
jgi:NhaA family Na+:H+ antiporter